MATYRFTWPGHEPATDVDLLDDAEAWSEMVTSAGEMLRDIDGSLPAAYSFEVVVVDESGRSIGWLVVTAGKGPRG